MHPMDPDLYELWVAVHDYLVCQASDPVNVANLSAAYARLHDQHNAIYERYQELIEPPAREIAGT